MGLIAAGRPAGRHERAIFPQLRMFAMLLMIIRIKGIDPRMREASINSGISRYIGSVNPYRVHLIGLFALLVLTRIYLSSVLLGREFITP